MKCYGSLLHKGGKDKMIRDKSQETRNKKQVARNKFYQDTYFCIYENKKGIAHIIRMVISHSIILHATIATEG